MRIAETSYTNDDRSATLKFTVVEVEKLYDALDVIWTHTHSTDVKRKVGLDGWGAIEDLLHTLVVVKERICPTYCDSCAKTIPVGHPGCLCKPRQEVMRAATAMQELFDDPEAPIQNWFSAKYASLQSKLGQARADYGKQMCAINKWEETHG